MFDVVSGLHWTMPMGYTAPGKTSPVSNEKPKLQPLQGLVPMNGLTYWVRLRVAAYALEPPRNERPSVTSTTSMMVPKIAPLRRTKECFIAHAFLGCDHDATIRHYSSEWRSLVSFADERYLALLKWLPDITSKYT